MTANRISLLKIVFHKLQAIESISDNQQDDSLEIH